MALWDPNKVKPLINKDVASMKPMSADYCFWCDNIITDKSTDESGNIPFWETSDGDSGCDSSSFGCQPWNDYHFHGNDGDRQVPHSEQEAEWMGQEFQENEDLCYGVASHQSIGQVLDMVDKGLVHRNYYSDSIEVSDNRRRLDEGIGTHCDEGHCNKAGCHTCNPDPQCSSHKTCVNSRICSECSEMKATHIIDWSSEHPCDIGEDYDEDHYNYLHPKYVSVEDDSLRVDRLKEAGLLDFVRSLRGGEWQSRVKEDIYDQLEYAHSDASSDALDDNDSFSAEPLQHPVCMNPDCKSYEE